MAASLSADPHAHAGAPHSQQTQRAQAPESSPLQPPPDLATPADAPPQPRQSWRSSTVKPAVPPRDHLKPPLTPTQPLQQWRSAASTPTPRDSLELPTTPQLPAQQTRKSSAWRPAPPPRDHLRLPVPSVQPPQHGSRPPTSATPPQSLVSPSTPSPELRKSTSSKPASQPPVDLRSPARASPPPDLSKALATPAPPPQEVVSLITSPLPRELWTADAPPSRPQQNLARSRTPSPAGAPPRPVARLPSHRSVLRSPASPLTHLLPRCPPDSPPLPRALLRRRARSSPSPSRERVKSGPPAATASPRLARDLQQPRRFFAAWQRRNERRTAVWVERGAAPAHTPLAALRLKLEHLKAEITSLVAQDIALFRQLFSLQEEILEMREQSELSSGSSDESSPCSTLSSSSSLTNLGALSKHSSSFVRHHVSYPPIARNRSYRIKSSAPQHGCQDSYDSGIHTSDHEIFV